MIDIFNQNDKMNNIIDIIFKKQVRLLYRIFLKKYELCI